MKKLLLALPLVALVAGCNTYNAGPNTNATLGGGAAGAAIGAAVADDGDRFEGALIGGALGAAAGNLIGRSQNRPGQCVYRNANGQQYYAACP